MKKLYIYGITDYFFCVNSCDGLKIGSVSNIIEKDDWIILYYGKKKIKTEKRKKEIKNQIIVCG